MRFTGLLTASNRIIHAQSINMKRMMSQGVKNLVPMIRFPQCVSRGLSTSPVSAQRLSNEDLSFLRESVRKSDREMYFCSNFMPMAGGRETFLLLRAFNTEISRIPEMTGGNPNTSALRYQFWRDFVTFISQTNPELSTASITDNAHARHPLADPFRNMITQHHLSTRWLSKMLESRELYDMNKGVTFSTLKELEQYCENTQAPTLYLTLEAMGIVNDASDIAASYVGRAMGLVTLLRGFGHNCLHGQMILPADLLAKHNLNADHVLNVIHQLSTSKNKSDASKNRTNNDTLHDAINEAEHQQTIERTKEALFDIAVLANAYLEDARTMRPDLPNEAIPALTVAIPTSRWLTRFEQFQFDFTRPELYQRYDISLIWSLIRHNFQHTF